MKILIPYENFKYLEASKPLVNLKVSLVKTLDKIGVS